MLIFPRTKGRDQRQKAETVGRRFRGDGTIDGVTDNGITSSLCLDDNSFIFLFRYNDSYFATILHCVQKDLISKDIEFLLVVSCGITSAS